MMLEVVLLLALALVALCALLVRRHQQTAAWDRELDLAFGVTAQREIPRHRSL
jgi:hypothetical protein